MFHDDVLAVSSTLKDLCVLLSEGFTCPMPVLRYHALHLFVGSNLKVLAFKNFQKLIVGEGHIAISLHALYSQTCLKRLKAIFQHFYGATLAERVPTFVQTERFGAWLRVQFIKTDATVTSVILW
jgi:hypothetical protein